MAENIGSVLVIGSAGTIGKPLVRELRRRGRVVREADLQHGGSPDVIRTDIAESRQVDVLLDSVRPEYVYNLAAEFGRHNGERYYEQCWRTNVIGGRHVMEACARRGIKLIHMSSSEAYGETPQPIMRESDTEQLPLRHHNDYAMTKWVNEQQIMNLERASELKAVRIRFFNAYGPGEYYHPFRSVVCLFTYAALMGLPYTVYRGYHRVFMYIDDAVWTLANVADNFIPGRVYNVGGSEYRSIEDVDRLLRDMLGERFISNVEVMQKDGHNTVNKRPSIELAERELGHRLTVDLETGLRRTVEWMQEVYPSSCRTMIDATRSIAL